MSVKTAVLKESRAGEKRVAITPTVASRLSRLGAVLAMETGAGLPATFADPAYPDTRCEPDPIALVADAAVVLAQAAKDLAAPKVAA